MVLHSNAHGYKSSSQVRVRVILKTRNKALNFNWTAKHSGTLIRLAITSALAILGGCTENAQWPAAISSSGLLIHHTCTANSRKTPSVVPIASPMAATWTISQKLLIVK